MGDDSDGGGRDTLEISTDSSDTSENTGGDIPADIPEDLHESEGDVSGVASSDMPADTPEDVSESDADASGDTSSDLRDDILEDTTDYFADSDRATEALEGFKDENWEMLSEDEKKESIGNLADYNAGVLGIENKPSIEYYYEESGNYGGYSESDNTIRINEYNLTDAAETADTIAHEYRHVCQHETAMNPESERDTLFQDNLKPENYIQSEQDYYGYVNQPVERDASDYAQQYRDFLHTI